MPTAVTCPSCGSDMPSGRARWCGSCGAPLSSRDTVGVGDTNPSVIRLDDDPVIGVEEEPPVGSYQRWIVLVLVVLMIVGLLAVQAGSVSSEPRGFTPHGDEARSGVVSLAPLGPPTDVAWRAPLTGTGGSQPQQATIDDADAVVAGPAGVTVHDRVTGEVRWHRPDLAVSGAPVILDGVIAVFVLHEPRAVTLPAARVQAHGRIVGLDAKDGTTLWTETLEFDRPTLYPHPAGLLFLDGTLGVGLLEPESGATIWRIETFELLDASVRRAFVGAPSRDTVHVMVTRPAGIDPAEVPPQVVTEHLVALNAADGTVRYELAADHETLAEVPVAVLGELAVGVDADRLYTWDAATGERLRVDLHGLANPLHAVVGAGYVAVIIDLAGTLTAYDARAGSPLWASGSPTGGVPAVEVAGDSLLVRDADRLSILNLQTGNLRATADLSPLAHLSPATPAGDHAVTHLGQLAVRSTDGSELGSWPTLTPPVPIPATRDGKVSVVTSAETTLFDAANGEQVWRLRTGNDPERTDPATVGAPVLTEDVLVFSPPHGRRPLPQAGLAGVDLVQAVFRWDRSTDDLPPTGPLTLVGGETVFLPVDDEIHGHDVLTGRRSFAARAGHPRGPVAAHREYVFAASAPTLAADEPQVTPNLIAVRRLDRTTAWTHPVEACSPPTVVGELVVVATPDRVRTFEVHRGDEQWSADLLAPGCVELAVSDERLVAAEGRRRLLALHVGTGDRAWEADLPAALVAAPTIAGETVLAPLHDGTILGIDLATGERVWSLGLGAIPASSVAVADGRLIVVTRAGELVAVETGG